MKKRLSRSLFASAFVVLFAALGCDSGPQLTPVKGVVTLDGSPLGDAIVEFQPTEGRPSYAVTDSNGRYDLKFTDERLGAATGSYTVRIRRNAASDDGVSTLKPLPTKYDSETELRAEVRPEGPPIDFALTSR